LVKPNGDVWQTDQWQAGMALVEFTNPAARRWFTGKLRAVLGMGLCQKPTSGERIPTDVVWFDGDDPERMHNFYSRLDTDNPCAVQARDPLWTVVHPQPGARQRQRPHAVALRWGVSPYCTRSPA
jgi:alpha-glucosidase (family GH31 glycosyl hydrolase)